jgi:hypothetical protein
MFFEKRKREEDGKVRREMASLRMKDKAEPI